MGGGVRKAPLPERCMKERDFGLCQRLILPSRAKMPRKLISCLILYTIKTMCCMITAGIHQERRPEEAKPHKPQAQQLCVALQTDWHMAPAARAVCFLINGQVIDKRGVIVLVFFQCNV